MTNEIIEKKYVTPVGRLSYPHILTKNDGGMFPSGKYEAILLIDKEEDLSDLKAKLQAALDEQFGAGKLPLAKLKHPVIRDGDEKGGDYEGCWYIKAKGDLKPTIVGPDPKIVLDEEQAKKYVYGGQNAKLSVGIYAYDKKGSKGVGLSLRHVQILMGGTPFGTGVSSTPDEDFKDETDGMEVPY